MYSQKMFFPTEKPVGLSFKIGLEKYINILYTLYKGAE